ncbi:MAG: DUF1449 family protein [Saprospiraceae bacterium]|nr:DUF1449 family protein [Saprospiraceae bacterium]
MQELLQAAFSPPNIVFTVLLLVVMLYWVSVFMGLLDMGSFDVDIDVDMDVDVDVDIDADIDADADVTAGGLAGILHFFNLGKVPFMIIMTFLVLSMWAISILLNHYVGHGSLGFAGLMFIPNLAVSLLITKIVTSPLVPIFKNLDTSEEPVDYIGQVCTLLLSASPNDLGQAEVSVNGSSLLVSVMADQKEIKKGEKALIVQENKEKSYFIVQKLED